MKAEIKLDVLKRRKMGEIKNVIFVGGIIFRFPFHFFATVIDCAFKHLGVLWTFLDFLFFSHSN